MNKRKKDKRRQFKVEDTRQPPKLEIIEMEPTTLAAFVHIAEKEVLPMIIERNIKPAAAHILLTHYTYWLITDDDTPLTAEKTNPLVRMLLALWQSGVYIPSFQYPFTFEETLKDMRIMQQREEDDTAFPSAIFPLEQRRTSRPWIHVWRRCQTSRDTSLASLDDEEWSMDVLWRLPDGERGSA